VWTESTTLWIGSLWTSGGGNARFHRRVAETMLRLAGPCREELGSKGEMLGTHSRGLSGEGGAGKGRLVATTASGQ
jgi:hypothetical protein